MNVKINTDNNYTEKLIMKLTIDKESKINIAKWAIWNKNYPTHKNNKEINVVWVRNDDFKIYINVDMIKLYNPMGLYYAIKNDLIKNMREEWWNWANVIPSSIIPIDKVIYNYSSLDLNQDIEDCELINIFSEYLIKQNLEINDVYDEFYKKSNINLKESWEKLNLYENEMNENKSLTDSEYINLIDKIDSQNKYFKTFLKSHDDYSFVINKIEKDSYNELINYVIEFITLPKSMCIK